MTPQELIKRRLFNDRVALLGASGWFGREHLALLQDIETLGTASETRDIEVDGRHYTVIAFDIKALERFKPTVVIDCAGLNRHREYKMTFLSECLELTLNYLRVASLPTVRAGMTFSSGAATFDPLGDKYSDYSASKILHESMVSKCGVPTIVMRSYAVTGRHCQERAGYAVTDFIDQSRKGLITVNSKNPVHRRYMAIDDYIAAGISELGKSSVLESAGYWIEMGQLASLIAHKTNAKVKRKKPSGVPEQYGARDSVTHRIAEREGFHVKNVDEQIEALL